MKRFLLLFSVIVFFASCERSPGDNNHNRRGQHFSVVVEQYDDQTASKVAAAELTQLKVGIYNASGELVSNVITTQSPNLSNISVEGLPDGAYTAVFIGIAELHSTQAPQIELPARLGSNWLPTIPESSANDNEYIYAKSAFNIVDNHGVEAKITLQRIVGRVEIEPNFTDGQWTKGSISSILVTFDDGSFYTSHLTDGKYSGEGNIKDVQAAKHFNFYTLPTIGDTPAHGFMTIIGTQGDGAPYSVFYEFDVVVEANKRTIIRPTYNLENDQFGTIRVYDSERTAATSRFFFKNGDSYKSIYARKFRTNALLALNFSNGNKKMTASFYSAKPVKNVTVYVRRNSDAEFFEIAWFESMLAFEDRTVDLSKLPDNRIYRTESGGTVMIDKMTNDLVYKYKSEDPHMQKLAQIKWPCEIRFVQPTADTLVNKLTYLPYRPPYAREAVTQFTNVGYLVSSDPWWQQLLAREKIKPFMESGKPVSLTNTFYPQVFNTGPRNYTVNSIFRPEGSTPWNGNFGMAYEGSGDFLAVQGFALTNHYGDGHGVNLLRVTAFHEYCHTVGYTHSGDFTHGQMEVETIAYIEANYRTFPYPTKALLNTENGPGLYVKQPDGSVK